MLRAPLLALTLALAAPAAAHASGELFTLAGAGSDEDALVDGGPAAIAPLEDPVALAGLADGGFLVGTEGVVWRVDPQGRLHRLAGRREQEGSTGDGGPALLAEVEPDHLAATPDGGYLLTDGDRGRVRKVAPDGTITTVAGGGTSRADGIPALRAALAEPGPLVALGDGSFALADEQSRVREVTPDGRIRTVAGGGRDPRIHGEPATAAELRVRDVAALPDGTLLLADPLHGAIDRVGTDGTVRVAARPPRADHVAPTLVTAVPGGGFAFAAEDLRAFTGASVRVYRAGPDGTVRRVAGGGPFGPAPLQGYAQRGDGGPATAQPLSRAVSLSALPDGGLLLAFEPGGGEADGDVVAYLAPDAPGVLAVALRRDGARVFRPGRASGVHVALTLPATVSLTAGGRTVIRALPAGPSTVPLPPGLSARPHTVTLAAADPASRGALDRGVVFPVGWLPEDTARTVADAVLSNRVATLCRRFSAGRVDCQAESEHDACGAISVRFAHARVLWGTYRACRLHAHPRYTRAPRPLRSRDWHCVPDAPACGPALSGRVRETDLIPMD